MKLTFLSLKQSFQNYRMFSFYVAAGMMSVFLCMSLMLGYARNNYITNTYTNTSATLAVFFDGSDGTAAPGREALEEGLAPYRDCTDHIIYIARTGDGTLLAGWDLHGNGELGQWIPVSSSRFFTQQEVEDAADVMINSSEEFSSWDTSEESLPLETRELTVDGVQYALISSHPYVSYNFLYNLSRDSRQDLVTGDVKIRIVPYTTLFKRYTPTLVYLTFGGATRSQLRRYVEEIRNVFPGAEVTLPKENSSTFYLMEKIGRSIVGAAMALISMMTLLSLNKLWVSAKKPVYNTYRLCGASQKRIFGSVCGEWLAFMLLGAALAELLHALMKPLLRGLRADCLPTFGDMAVVIALTYGLTLLFSAGDIKKCLAVIERRDD